MIVIGWAIALILLAGGLFVLSGRPGTLVKRLAEVATIIGGFVAVVMFLNSLYPPAANNPIPTNTPFNVAAATDILVDPTTARVPTTPVPPTRVPLTSTPTPTKTTTATSVPPIVTKPTDSPRPTPTQTPQPTPTPAPYKETTVPSGGPPAKTYNERLGEGQIIVGHADKFQGYSGCVAFLIVGPGNFGFSVESGIWDRWRNTTPSLYQPLLQEQIDTLVNKYDCTPVKTVRLP